MKPKISELGYAIVLGCAHFNALGAIRSLGEAGVPSVLIYTSSWSNAAYSKFTLKSYRAENAASLRDAILDAVRAFGGKPTVFPTADNLLLWLDEIRADIRDKVILPQVGAQAQQFLRKDVMSLLAQRAGFPIPKTEQPDDTSAEAIRKAVQTVGYPCILKPISGVNGAKGDIRILQSDADLPEALTVFGNYPTFLIQEFIDAPDSMMVEYCGCKIPGQKTLVYGEMRKIREFPANRGSTSFARIVPQITYIDPDVLDAFLEDVGFSGVFDLEIKVANGKGYFLEINYRSGAPFYGFTKAGFNVFAAWHLLATGREVPPITVRETFVQCEGLDLSNAFAHNISLAQWMHDFRAADAHMVFNFRDNRPLLSSYRMLKPFIQAKIESKKE